MHATSLRVVIGVATMMASLGAAAAASPHEIATWRRPDEASRLVCFDRLFPPIPGAKANETAPRKEAEPIERNADAKGAAARLDELWDLTKKDPEEPIFAVRQYKPVYVLPAFYSTSPNGTLTSPNKANTGVIDGPIDHLEGKFQLSLKTKLLPSGPGQAGLWFGYTQVSRWQVYNRERSRPFRATDYEPEVIGTIPLHVDLPGTGWGVKMLGLSATHQSNGRDLPQSRSWNRVIGTLGLERDNWTVLVRPWLRLREQADRDDNADILDYMGRGEVTVLGAFGGSQLAVTLRHTLRGGARSRGSIAVDYALPFRFLQGSAKDNLKLHLQFFSGYGESITDYNHRQHAAGIGLSVLEWK